MILLILIVVLITLLLCFSRKSHKYWSERNVPHIKPLPLIGNSFWLLFRTKCLSDMIDDVYKAFPGKRYIGIYNFMKPALIVKDPELIKQILIKDFDHFPHHSTAVSEESDPIWSKSLLTIRGGKWRTMRAILSPAFTGSKMRIMFDFISQISDNFSNYFLQKNQDDLELTELFRKFSNDVIAMCAFGIKTETLKSENNELYKIGLEAFIFDTFWKNFKFFVVLMVPRLANILNINLFSLTVRNFFTNLVAETIKVRESQNVVRPDMIHLLMEAKKGKIPTYQELKNDPQFEKSFDILKPELDDMDVTAQALIFHFGGFDTVSSFISVVSHELIVNEDIQRKLQEEIDETFRKCEGKLTYEALMKMKYLDMVINETLRKWPIAGVLDRECNKHFTIEPIEPNEKPLHLQPGDNVWIPVVGIHHDPEYYPEPNRFDPERFRDDTKLNQYTYLPFGLGPRNCIGNRLALLIGKVIITHMFRKFNFLATEKTQIPLKLSRKHVTFYTDKGIWCKLQLR